MPEIVGTLSSGEVIGEDSDGTLWRGTPKQVTHADLGVTVQTPDAGKFIQEWGYEGQVMLRQTLIQDAWIADRTEFLSRGRASDDEVVAAAAAQAQAEWEAEISRESLPVVWTKGVVDGQLADVPVTMTVYTWEAI